MRRKNGVSAIWPETFRAFRLKLKSMIKYLLDNVFKNRIGGLEDIITITMNNVIKNIVKNYSINFFFFLNNSV